MTIQFEVPMTCRQIADCASTMMLEGGALAKLASALAEFEETTGRRLFVSEGVTGVSDAVYTTSGAEARWLADSEAGVYDTDMPDEATGVEIENAAFARQFAPALEAAAQAGAAFRATIQKSFGITGDGSGEPLPPIEDEATVGNATEPEAHEAGGPSTATDPQPASDEPAEAEPKCQHLVTHRSMQLGKVTCEQCGDTISEFDPKPVQDAHTAAAKPSAKPVAPGVGRASFTTEKPKATSKPKADDRPWGKLTLPERQIVKHLERLPDTFAPQDDLQLAEMLTGGDKIDTAAAFLEVEPAVALARWKSFLSEDVIGTNGKPTIDGQQWLLNALRYRVETGA